MNDANELRFSLLHPILEDRLEAMKDPKFKAPPDLIQLVIDGSPDGKGHSLDYQVNAQIGTGRAALPPQRSPCFTFSMTCACDPSTLHL